MARRRFGLSKSKIIAGLQCPKRLWLETHRPELVELTPATERRFAIGHEVGEVARQLTPGGTLIGAENGVAAALRDTDAAVASGGATLLYEPCFSHDGVLIRADNFERQRNRIEVTEVKASTELKDYHLNDAAVQAWVMEQAADILGGAPFPRYYLDFETAQFPVPREGWDLVSAPKLRGQAR